MSSNLPISARVRPNSEAAPWVIDEIRDLEARADRLAGALRVLLPLLARDEDRAVTGIFGGDTLDAIDAARAAIEASANSRNEEESMACKSDDDLSDEALWAGIAAGMITPTHIAPGKAKPTPDAVEQIAHRTCSTYTHGERPTYAFERHTLQDFAYRLSGLLDAQAEVLESEKAQLRAEIDRLQSHLTVSARAFSALEAVAAEARRNDAIAMSWIAEAKHAIGCEGDMPGFIEALRALKADPWPTIARGMITPAHISPPCKAPPPPNDLEASIRDTIAHFIGGDDLAKDAADAVLEIVRPLAERSDRLECALREVKEAVEFTPLGVRGIKALQAARAALEELK